MQEENDKNSGECVFYKKDKNLMEKVEKDKNNEESVERVKDIKKRK